MAKVGHAWVVALTTLLLGLAAALPSAEAEEHLWRRLFLKDGRVLDGMMLDADAQHIVLGLDDGAIVDVPSHELVGMRDISPWPEFRPSPDDDYIYDPSFRLPHEHLLHWSLDDLRDGAWLARRHSGWGIGGALSVLSFGLLGYAGAPAMFVGGSAQQDPASLGVTRMVAFAQTTIVGLGVGVLGASAARVRRVEGHRGPGALVGVGLPLAASGAAMLHATALAGLRTRGAAPSPLEFHAVALLTSGVALSIHGTLGTVLRFDRAQRAFGRGAAAPVLVPTPIIGPDGTPTGATLAFVVR